jgi:hypothetical protein
MLLAALLLVQGCVGARAVATGGSGWSMDSRWVGREGEAQEEARQAEVKAALEWVWSLANGEREVGARLAFTFWVQNGAPFFVEYMRGSG